VGCNLSVSFRTRSFMWGFTPAPAPASAPAPGGLRVGVFDWDSPVADAEEEHEKEGRCVVDAGVTPVVVPVETGASATPTLVPLVEMIGSVATKRCPFPGEVSAIKARFLLIVVAGGLVPPSRDAFGGFGHLAPKVGNPLEGLFYVCRRGGLGLGWTALGEEGVLKTEEARVWAQRASPIRVTPLVPLLPGATTGQLPLPCSECGESWHEADQMECPYHDRLPRDGARCMPGIVGRDTKHPTPAEWCTALKQCSARAPLVCPATRVALDRVVRSIERFQAVGVSTGSLADGAHPAGAAPAPAPTPTPAPKPKPILKPKLKAEQIAEDAQKAAKRLKSSEAAKATRIKKRAEHAATPPAGVLSIKGFLKAPSPC
jgi:hypothetical protein